MFSHFLKEKQRGSICDGDVTVHVPATPQPQKKRSVLLTAVFVTSICIILIRKNKHKD